MIVIFVGRDNGAGSVVMLEAGAGSGGLAAGDDGSNKGGAVVLVLRIGSAAILRLRGAVIDFVPKTVPVLDEWSIRGESAPATSGDTSGARVSDFLDLGTQAHVRFS